MYSNDQAISVTNLSKRYEIYDAPHDRLKQFVVPSLQRLCGQSPKQYFREFWALQGVSFEIKKNETVGIIGRNGSGKSTLLQMICGTLTPTSGTIAVKGRVAALLELGAGFNPEFTGRDNIFTNGVLLGLSQSEIEARYNEIVAFADIGQFIDQPVKTYSSGMFVRLAFAIAANMDPNILIIDEALAVGDLAFQAKCMARLRELTEAGTTILFVSHDLSSVRNICKKVLWLNEGQVIDFGSPKEIVESYTRQLHLEINKATGASVSIDAALACLDMPDADLVFSGQSLSESHKRYGDGAAQIVDVAMIDSHGHQVKIIDLHEKFTIRMTIKANADVERPVIGFSFRDLKGNQVVGAMSSNFPEFEMPSFLSGSLYIIEIKGINNLAQGPYTLTVGIENIIDHNKLHQFLDVIEDALVFSSTFGSQLENIFPAMVWQDIDFSLRKINSF